MNNGLQIFENENFGNVRTLVEGEIVWFVGSDIAKNLGYSNVSKAINDHCRDVTKRYIATSVANANGVIEGKTQQKEMNCIKEGDIYRLIVRSKLPSAEKFEKWVFDEVLPQIRKTGSYKPQIDKKDELLLGLFSNDSLVVAQSHKELVKLEMAPLMETIEIQEETLKEQAPKIEYHDAVLDSKGTLTSKQIGAEFGLSAQQLNKILHEERVQYKVGKQWILYKHHLNKGYTESTTHLVGEKQAVMHTKWTQKGREFIHQLMAEIRKR